MHDLVVAAAVVIACAVLALLWHVHQGRDHRGGHARFDVNHSAYALARRIQAEHRREQQQGKHRFAEAEGAPTLLAGGDGYPLLAGYRREDAPARAPRQWVSAWPEDTATQR